MAKYRAIQTRFWSDPWILGLTPELKFFYIYLFTNPKVSQCGVYEISIVQMQHETGFTKNKVIEFLKFLEQKKKILFSIDTSEICIINFSKYNYFRSPSIKTCIRKEFAMVKNKDLIEHIYGINSMYREFVDGVYTVVKECTEKEKEKEEKKENPKKKDCDDNLVKEILSFFGFDVERDKDKKEEVIDFLTHLIDLDKYHEFKRQFKSYKDYKAKSREKIHGFSTFLGSSKNQFRNGGWCAENWDFKLQNLNQNSKQINFSNRYQAGRKNHEEKL